jgi:hypothetical protein
MSQPKATGPGFTVAADLISGLIDCVTQCGVPRARFADLLDQGGPGRPAPARCAGEHILKLWDRILRETGDPIIGYRMAFFAGLKTFGVLGQILPRCATVYEAYRQNARYVALASQATQFTVTRTPKTLTISVALDVPNDLARPIMIWGLTNLCLVPQRLAGVMVAPKQVTCAFPSPGSDAVRMLRERLPYRFDGDANAVVFDRCVGDIAVPSADADLQRLLEETMDRRLATLGQPKSLEQGMLTLLRGMMKRQHADPSVLEQTIRNVGAHVATAARRGRHQLPTIAAPSVAGGLRRVSCQGHHEPWRDCLPSRIFRRKRVLACLAVVDRASARCCSGAVSHPVRETTAYRRYDRKFG